MKKVFTFLALFLIIMSQAQSPSLQAWTVDASGTNTLIALSNGTVVSYTTTASTPSVAFIHSVKVMFKNISSVTHTYSVIRTDLAVNAASPGALPYFCFGDLGTCYSTFANEPNNGDYSVLAPGAFTTPGKQLVVYLEEAHTVGYSEINYKLFEQNTGKTSFDTLSFTIRYNQLTGINENKKTLENVSNIYPNPSSNNANISIVLNDAVPVKVQVFNSIGSLIYNGSEQFLYGQNRLSVDCSNFNSGLYFVTVTAGNSKVTKRLVVNK